MQKGNKKAVQLKHTFQTKKSSRYNSFAHGFSICGFKSRTQKKNQCSLIKKTGKEVTVQQLVARLCRFSKRKHRAEINVHQK